MRTFSAFWYSPASHALNLGSFKFHHWTESDASLLHSDNEDLVRKLAGGRHSPHKGDHLAIGREHARFRARGRSIVRAQREASSLAGSNLGYTNAVVQIGRAH